MAPKKPAKSKDGFQTVRLKQELTKEIDDIVASPLGKKIGIKSRADLVTRAVVEFLEEHKSRYMHLNMMENTVRIVDFQTKRIATIIFRENGSAYCELCRSLDCEHVKYALEQPEILEELKKNNWQNNY